MKKLFLFAVAAAALVACSNEELSTPDNALVSKEAPVNFDVYTQRSMTRGGVAGTNDNTNIGTRGFGVFAYYTAGEVYDAKATPNFMYNQKVTCSGTITENQGAGLGKWTYEPVKYWPNEFGQNAQSDEVDYVTFFAYAPWTDIDPTTGNVKVGEKPTKGANESDVDFAARLKVWENQQKYNIISVNKNTATGDPLIKYVVDTDPATSVDLLWGVAAENPTGYYSKGIGGNNVTIDAGKPFINLVKPNDPAKDLLRFNLKHALAKVRVTIDYIDDAPTPAGPAVGKIETNKTTRIYVRSFKMSGFATKGALNLNNTGAGEPLWKDYDGVKDLAFDEITFQDGRKDGKEGETNGAQSNETPQGLNPNIIENYAKPVNNQFVDYDATAATGKTPGVTKDPQLLFGGTQTTDNGGYFYVIPRNEGTTPVDITIAYDVETIDPALAGKLSDGDTHGISIENIISKTDIFQGTDFKAGYTYEINIHLGMTSVKVDAFVTPWQANNQQDVDLPANQDDANQGNNQNQTATQQAINYQYPADNAYTYSGTFAYVDETHLTYTVSAANAQNGNAMNDLARFLGALYRAGGVQTLTYKGTNYTWDTAGTLHGSNWKDGQGNTLVSVITAEALQQFPTSLTISIDGTEVITTINVE